MTITQALEELKKYAQDFAKVGDAKQAIENNKDEFFHKWAKVNQYYKYVINNTKSMSDEWFMAVDTISDISIDNPSLEEWIKMMIEPDHKKTQIQSQNNMNFDTATISSAVESLTSEVKNMQHWDPEHLKDVEWQLREYQKILIASQSSFEPNIYQSLMEDIDASLDKIGRFNNMLSSDVMEGIKRM